MNKKRVTYIALGAFVFAASCTNEAAEPGVYDWAEGDIYFRTTLAGVGGSRADDMTLDRLESFQVTCFNTADTYKDPDGFLSPYFENATFIRKTGSQLATFIASPAEGPRYWPGNEGLMRFFAFSPSLTAMADGNSVLESIGSGKYFNLINTTISNGSETTVGYRLDNIRINPEISRQFDFITAEVSGERWKDFSSGIDLAFRHQLCQVELRAWGEGSGYDFEIAGVRLGNPTVEGTYVFADDGAQDTESGWEPVDDPVTGKVEYLYRAAMASESGNMASADKIYRITGQEHSSPGTAESIMGRGGCAMVIPTVNTKWEGLADPDITAVPYSTERMYFSILIRVSDPATGATLYPYPGNPYGMKVISYAVDASGNILRRLYTSATDGTYFTDPGLLYPYEASEGEEIRDFGWAAVPVDADWSAGKRYIYTLNYSEGIGLHDPEDPEPGKPLLEKAPIEWGVSVGGWDTATPDGNYTPDLDVPCD